ncbi:MAG TPA: alpha/beta fold hydrolase [Gaiellaceae bacterium]|nr:alpha/beta fold hydrolase [Gaiellaceae bacterium]
MFPRPLTSRERETLDFLLSRDFPGRQALCEQASMAVVTGGCTCGCPTIDLAVDDPTEAPRAEVRDRQPVHASTRVRESFENAFELLLFVDDGLLSMLEVTYYDTVPSEFPSVDLFEPPQPAELDAPGFEMNELTVPLADRVGLHVVELGPSLRAPHGLPLIVLHGGPGLDHSMFRPYLDPLADEFRLLYVDERGQGRSERVDPATLSLDVFARDVDLLAEALELERFALLGHSFGAIIATKHAIELGTAAAYVISGGADSSDAMMADLEASFAEMGDAAGPIAESWEQEKSVETDDELRELLRVQLPFHFAGEPPPGYGDDTVFSAEVLRHFAKVGYGDFDYTSDLGRVSAPTLVIVGEHDRTATPRAARVLHEGIAGSELEIVPSVGHMSFVESPEIYLGAVRTFLREAVA